jgi:hypothetical protein
LLSNRLPHRRVLLADDAVKHVALLQHAPVYRVLYLLVPFFEPPQPP